MTATTQQLIERLTHRPMKEARITFQPSKQVWRDARLNGWDTVPESSVAAFVQDVRIRPV